MCNISPLLQIWKSLGWCYLVRVEGSLVASTCPQPMRHTAHYISYTLTKGFHGQNRRSSRRTTSTPPCLGIPSALSFD